MHAFVVHATRRGAMLYWQSGLLQHVLLGLHGTALTGPRPPKRFACGVMLQMQIRHCRLQISSEYLGRLA